MAATTNDGPRLRTPDERRAEHPYCRECKAYCERTGRDWAHTASNCAGILVDEDYEYLAAATKMTVDEVRSIYDPTTWVKENLVFDPFWYQDRILRCTSSRRVLRQGRRCLEESTRVLLSDGRWKQIKDVEVGDSVVARRSTDGSKTTRKVLSRIDNGIQETVLISLSDGTSIQATAEHRFLEYVDGAFGWRSIETGLGIGSFVQVLRGVSFDIAEIRSIVSGGMAHVYDLEVAEDHNFVAEGIVSHNSGKTQTVTAWLLQQAFTNDGVKIVAITPMKSQAKEIYDRIHEYLDANLALLHETRSKQQPYFEINFRNGSRIRIFVAGTSEGTNSATQVRGQEADIIYIDEMDYLSDDAATAIMPLLSDPQRRGEPVRFVGSSTPSGKEGTFFRLCGDSYYREFLIPSTYRPDWTEKMEAECRALAKTQRNYVQEYLAEWGAKSDGVFRRNDVIAAMKPYRYDGVEGVYEQAEWPRMAYWPHWTYIMGADWNGKGTGTRIVVVGFDPVHEKWLVVYRETIDLSQFALHVAVERIVALNRAWRCHAVYIDAGFGQMQDEYLRRIGRQAQEARAAGAEYDRADIALAERLQAVDFGSSFEYEIDDPQSGKRIKIKKRLKNYIVENAQRHFELKDFWFSMADSDLKQEAIGYSAPRADAHGQLIYEGDPEAGDHDLDALMLALYGFNREFDPEFQRRTDSRVVLAKRPGQSDYERTEEMPDPAEDPVAYRSWLDAQHGRPGRDFRVESREIELPQQATANLPALPQGASYAFASRGRTSRTSVFGGGSIPSRNAWRSAPRSRNGL
jgi:hypothetical protein